MKRYDIIVIGTGGGTKIARPAAAMGLRVALIEKDAVGGTCLNRGCIPSKMLIYPAEVRDLLGQAEKFRLRGSTPGTIDFTALVNHVSSTVDESSNRQRAEFETDAQIDFYPHAARFLSNDRIQAGEDILAADLIFIATGSRPRLPAIEGLDATPYMTSREALRNTRLPESLLVIGAGYIAAELGYAYAAFGTRVDFVVRSRFLRGQDPDLVEEFESVFSRAHGIHKGFQPTRVSYCDDGFRLTCTDANGCLHELQAEALLVAAGIDPDTDTLGLENTDITLNSGGYIEVNDHLQTAVPTIYAFGDCIGNYLFRHTVNYEGEYLVRRVLKNRSKEPIAYGPVPWAVFTHPQIAGVGENETSLRDRGIDYVVGLARYADSTPGMARSSEAGFVKVIAEQQSRRILGAHIVGDEASNMIHLFIAAMKKESSVDDLLDMIFIHPALPEVARDAVRDAGRKLGIYDG